MSDLGIVALEPGLEPAWEAFVGSHRQGLLYQTLRYRDFLVAITGATPLYRVAVRQGAIVGVLPVMSASGPHGEVLNALPFFGSYGAPLAVDDEVGAALWAEWSRMVEAPGVAAATVVMNPLAPDETPPIVIDVEDHRLGQFTALPEGGDPAGTILAGIDSSARRNIRKAESFGLEIVDDPDALSFLESAHCANMTEIGGTPKPASYFAETPRCFRHGIDWRLYVARKDGVPVAAVLLFYANGTVEYFTPGITPQGRDCQATALLLHRAMVEAASRGYRSWNWGGTWHDQDGVFRFKKKWGASARPYRYFVRLRDQALLRLSRADLLAAYPHFYVLPFRLLSS